MRVNPFNLEHVVEQLDAALSMSINERAARLAKDYKFVCDNTTATWLKVARLEPTLHASHVRYTRYTCVTRVYVAQGGRHRHGCPLACCMTVP